jgi:hypothetical protein
LRPVPDRSSVGSATGTGFLDRAVECPHRLARVAVAQRDDERRDDLREAWQNWPLDQGAPTSSRDCFAWEAITPDPGPWGYSLAHICDSCVFAGLWANGDTWARVDDVTVAPA